MSLGLRYNGLLAFLMTLVNLIATAFLLSRYAVVWNSSLLNALPLLTCVVAVLCVALYEYFRRQGNVLYDEISDELEWNVRSARLAEGGKLAEYPPDVNVRIVVRMFAHATDLPLFPGDKGPAIYVLLNLGLVLIGYFAH